jgi:gamma-glutamyl-gamma-aminobutyrate hydrolase PuuD
VFGQESVKVNSLHHQAIKKLADPLAVCATAKDGVVEAVCDTQKPFVWGVQWHPERMENARRSSPPFPAPAPCMPAEREDKVKNTSSVFLLCSSG